MTNMKSTKRALLVSVLGLALCFAMLLGSTFAWFTDSAASKGNTINAGTLEVGLENKVGGSYVDATADTAAAIFSGALWEPGFRQVAYVKISNNGSLALKANMQLTIDSGTIADGNLAEVIDVYVIEGDTAVVATPDASNKVGNLKELVNGSIDLLDDDKALTAGAEQAYTIVLVMNTSAGNDYKGKTSTEFYLNVSATQLASESDSIDDQYDAAAD